MTTHQKKPIIIPRTAGHNGEKPNSKSIGYPSVKSFHHLNNWSQAGQVFSYSGPPDYILNSDINIESNFYVVLHAPVPSDTTQATRRLGGYLIPWRYSSGWGGDPATYLRWVSAKWTPAGESEETLFSIRGQYFPRLTDGTKWTDTSTNGYAGYKLDGGYNSGFELGGSGFYYEPDDTSGFYYGKLTLTGICPAALGIWTLPEAGLTETNQQISLKHFTPGNSIRGYTGDDRQSLGDVIHRFGVDDFDEDYVQNNAMRCLFQWGHPVGVYHNTTDYTELGTAGTTYKIKSQNITGSSSGTKSAYPVVIVTCTGAGESNAGYVKLTTSTGSDTWTVSTEENTIQMLDWTDASMDTLAFDSDAADELKIEIKAPTSGEILLHTVALWEENTF